MPEFRSLPLDEYQPCPSLVRREPYAPEPMPRRGRGQIHGQPLSPDALEKVYSRNARRGMLELNDDANI